METKSVTNRQQWVQAVLATDDLSVGDKMALIAMAAAAQQQPDGTWTVEMADQ